MSFNNWDSSVHNDIDQIKRIISAKKISTSDVNIDYNNESALISGSSDCPYSVTLESCSCYDFESRNLPCKHIYRLAIDLGYLSDLPTLDKKLSKNFDIQSETSRFYDYYKSGIISAEKFIKIADSIKKGK